MDKTKKYLRNTILILALFIVGGCVSGVLFGQGLNTGFFVGVSASEVDGDSYSGFNKLGPAVGLYMNQHIDVGFYWQIELKYGTRGVYKPMTESDPTSFKSSYHILELPISVFYLFDEKFKLETGISPEVVLLTRFWEDGVLLNPNSYPEEHKLGLSVFAGIAYRPRTDMEIGLRYTNSAVPFRDREEWNHARYRGFFHNVITLTFSYRFKRHDQANESVATKI